METGEPLSLLAQRISALAIEPGHEGLFNIRANRLGDQLILTADDVTEQNRLEGENARAAQQKEIHFRLVEQREKDRQEIARDIHDGPIQTLSSIIFSLQFLKEAYPDSELRAEVEGIAASIKGAVKELRAVINELRPPAVIRFGLSKAIRQHAEDMAQRAPQLQWSYDLAENDGDLPAAVTLSLYRVYQEAANNIVKHSGARRAWVKFHVEAAGAPGRSANLEVGDDGQGFAQEFDMAEFILQKHFGLAGIAERVDSVGGAWSVRTRPGGGTVITARVPVEG
jgi:signal transduction histidine kinase